MPDFRKTRAFGGSSGESRLVIREERQFTNPHVRFVRIKGRIVPILNKKRIGQTSSKTGNVLITAGAVMGVAGGSATFFGRKKQKRASKFLANPRTAKIFKAAATAANKTMHLNNRTNGLLKFGKRSAITAAAVGLLGIGAKVVGTDLQTRSPFGADL